MHYKILPFIFFIAFSLQGQNFNTLIENFLVENKSKLLFSTVDLSDIRISDESYSKSMDLNLIYVQQHYQNIPIHNAIGTFAIKNEKVVNFKHSFLKNLETKVEQVAYSISPEAAINKVLIYLNRDPATDLEVLEFKSQTSLIYRSNTTSVEDIPIKLMYVKHGDKLKLAWNLSVLISEDSHWWSISIDANTSEIIRKDDWMLTCNFERYTSNHNHKQKSYTSTLNFNNESSLYRAFPLGVESPNHGGRVLLNAPADPVASEFGWHDTDGVPGAEFTITRGNNVLASEDRDGNDIPGYSPDGNSNLSFDFPINSDVPPQLNEDAAITNLFVWNNFTHDVWYHYGFDEASGNFQEFNYSGFGAGGDFVFADAQDGAGINNANFGTPPDGFNPRMQMFLWSPPGLPADLFTVNSPSDIAGSYFAREATFGPGVPITPITADLALVEDNNLTSNANDPHDACDPILNAANLNGKIAVINRGECTFVSKIQAAQNAGAIAVIMINNVPGDPINMGGSSAFINIPSVMISQSDGFSIINKLQNSESINATLVNNGPYELDGDFDNGIIAHEYGHGISNRLTGGPSQADCLFNDEQMGEGWSDWIGLMMTMKAEDTAEQPRGYGTFAISQPVTGNGIRPAPYSTDFAVNPATYGLTNNTNLSRPHGIGFVWATILWDLTWELIDQYGFDPDLINGNGGNNLAMQLVTDGMKLQNCNPGFVDGRDAILQADMLANNGANQCFIWKVFAARGVGFTADQGDALDRFDQTEAFDLPQDITLPCQVLSAENFNESQIKIYPNPATNVVNIAQVENIGIVQINIFNVNGRLLLSEKVNLNEKQNIDVSILNTGVYVLNIKNDRQSFSKKLIIN